MPNLPLGPPPATPNKQAFNSFDAGGNPTIAGDFLSEGAPIGAIVPIPALTAKVVSSPSQSVSSNGLGHTIVNLALGENVYSLLSENTTVDNPSNPSDGSCVTFLFLNTSGNFTVAWGTKFHLVGGNPAGAPVITIGAKYSMVMFMYFKAADIYVELSRALNL